jgi:hypothetical protein
MCPMLPSQPAKPGPAVESAVISAVVPIVIAVEIHCSSQFKDVLTFTIQHCAQTLFRINKTVSMWKRGNLQYLPTQFFSSRAVE